MLHIIEDNLTYKACILTNDDSWTVLGFVFALWKFRHGIFRHVFHFFLN